MQLPLITDGAQDFDYTVKIEINNLCYNFKISVYRKLLTVLWSISTCSRIPKGSYVMFSKNHIRINFNPLVISFILKIKIELCFDASFLNNFKLFIELQLSKSINRRFLIFHDY